MKRRRRLAPSWLLVILAILLLLAAGLLVFSMTALRIDHLATLALRALEELI